MLHTKGENAVRRARMGIVMVETMKWENGKLILLDQTKLPVSVEWIFCDTYQRVGKAIQKLEVRGAPAIGAAAAFAMVLAWRKIVEKYETKRDAANTSNMQLQTYAAMLYGSHDHAAKKLQQQLLKKFLQARNDLDAIWMRLVLPQSIFPGRRS